MIENMDLPSKDGLDGKNYPSATFKKRGGDILRLESLRSNSV
jgi:hypothetical protein